MSRYLERKIAVLLPAAALSALLTACSGGTTGPTPPGNGGGGGGGGGTTNTVRGTIVGVVSGQPYNSGTATIGGVQGNISEGGNYSVTGVPSGNDVTGTFSGNDMLGLISKFRVNQGNNQYESVQSIEKRVDGMDIEPNYLAALVNTTRGVGRPNTTTRDGVVNWNSTPEVLLVADSFNVTELLSNLYRFNFRQGGIDNAQIHLPRLLSDNPSPLNWREVNGNYTCNDIANRNKILLRGGTPQDIDSATAVAANYKWLDSDNNIYCAEIIMTDKSGPGNLNHEFANITGLSDTNNPNIPSIVNSGRRTATISDADIVYSKIKRKMRNGSKITNGMYDVSHLGTITGSASQGTTQTLRNSIDDSLGNIRISKPTPEDVYRANPMPPEVIRQRKDRQYR